MLGRLLGWYTIGPVYILGTLAPNRILPGAKCILRPSLAFSYWQRYSMALEHCASAKLCGVVQGMESEGSTCIRQGGHHVGHRPTF